MSELFYSLVSVVSIFLLCDASAGEPSAEQLTVWMDAVTNSGACVLSIENHKMDINKFHRKHMEVLKVGAPKALKDFLNEKTGKYRNEDHYFTRKSRAFRAFGQEGLVMEVFKGGNYKKYQMVFYEAGRISELTPWGGFNFRSVPKDSEWLVLFKDPKTLPPLVVEEGPVAGERPLLKLASHKHGIYRLDQPNHLGLPKEDMLHDVRLLCQKGMAKEFDLKKLKTDFFRSIGEEVLKSLAEVSPKTK